MAMIRGGTKGGHIFPQSEPVHIPYASVKLVILHSTEFLKKELPHEMSKCWPTLRLTVVYKQVRANYR